MRRRFPALAMASIACLLAGLLAVPATTPAAVAAPGITVTPLWFKVKVGPKNDTTCTLDARLFLPAGASAKKRVPAVLATNGFGGSQGGLTTYGQMFAKHGYAVLVYSGLGFGGSSCPISLDAPAYDGKAARFLVSYLGGQRGHAYLDADLTRPAPSLDVVRRDRRDANGKRSRHDPRVGMFGGSYGGGAQFAAAAVDPRIDALVPLVTWNDLSYSLAPNNTTQRRGAAVTSKVTGVAKLNWALGFSASGIAGGLTHVQVDPQRLIGCPDFQLWVCPTLITAGVTGTLDRSASRRLHRRSVAANMKRIKVPVLLGQGQLDTLFNLNEAIATFRALRRQGTETKMFWFSGGHSGPAKPGDLDEGALNARSQYVPGRALAWFEHHLKGRSVSTGPRFAYFRPWVKYRGNAKPAYKNSSSFPPSTRTRSYYLSGTNRLVTARSAVKRGQARFVTPPAGAPSSFDPMDVLGDLVPVPFPENDLAGTYARYTTPKLRSAVKVVGVPRLRLKVSAPITSATSPAGAVGALVLFVKILDVRPGGKARIVRNLIAPVRVTDTSKAFTVRLPAFVHRFSRGHRIRLIVAGGSSNYRGGLVPTPVTISSGKAQVLKLPTLR